MHQIIWEIRYGYGLRHDDIIHHINGNKLDNRLENLQLMTKSEHMSHHKLGSKHTLKARANMRKAHAGDKGASLETLAKMRLTHLGKHLSLETRAKIGAASKERYHRRENLGLSNFGWEKWDALITER